MLRVFIGYDENEVVAYHTLAHSIMRHASQPVSITPLKIDQLPMWRKRDLKQSTEFAFSRFLVPWLCDFKGMALFMDCDMLCRHDIVDLFAQFNEKMAVQVVKHDYTPKTDTKFLDQEQTRYAKKNWSSVMLFNNARCKELTVDYVNNASGLELHQFNWLWRQNLIGSLSKEWNHLVGEYETNPNAKLVHFTLGGPYFSGYEHCEYALEWFEEMEKANYSNNQLTKV